MIATSRASTWIPGAAFSRRHVVGTALLVAFAYVVLVGGTIWGEVDPTLRLFNGLIGGVAIAYLAATAHRGVDRVDGLVIIAVALFAVAGVLSAFPRQSLDAITAALAFGAAFLVARRALASEWERRRLVMLLIALSLVMTMIFAARWLVPIAEWWRTTGLIPPLNFELYGTPWGHRHDLALLIALLYPAWWIGRPSTIRRVGAFVFGILGGLIVLVDGSRAVWLSLAGASLIVLTPHVVRWWRSKRIPVLVPIIGLTVTVGLAVATGIGGLLVQRATNLATLDYRAAMVGPLLENWTTHPIAGNGPGSFPWILQLTDYFDTNSWAPRHPDSAVVQGLAEGGLLAIGAMVAIVIGIAPSVMRSTSTAARWSLVIFAIACLGASPTDFAFLIVVAIAWAAFAAPFEPASGPVRPRSRPFTAMVIGSLVLIGAAFVSTAGAAFAFEAARSHAGRGDLAATSSALDVAVTLDPGMAAYVRHRGAVHYLQSDDGAAIRDLSRATELNGSDDLAWRTLALAHLAGGRESEAEQALAQAVDFQRSDATNLLLAARFGVDEGDTEAATRLLAEAVHAWPQTAFALAWPELLPSTTTTADVVAMAIERWESGVPVPELVSDQALWLMTMAGRDDLASAASAESPSSRAIDDAFILVSRCDQATRLLAEMAPAEGRTYFYWWLVVADAERHGLDSESAAHTAALMGHPVPEAGAVATLNPMNENGSLSADRFGYRRRPIVWPPSDDDLPAAGGGMMRWMYRAADAVESAGLDTELPTCLATSP